MIPPINHTTHANNNRKNSKQFSINKDDSLDKKQDCDTVVEGANKVYLEIYNKKGQIEKYYER